MSVGGTLAPDGREPPPSVLGHRMAFVDVLRAIAILAVIVRHLPEDLGPFFGVLYRTGGRGVDLFFVLSGFLIGSTCLERATHLSHAGLLNQAKAYWLLRSARIFPLYFLLLGVFALGLPGFNPGAAFILRNYPLPFLTFTSNHFAQNTLELGIFWSLAIEEQFYLAVGLLILACSSSRRTLASAFLGLALAAIAVSLVYRHELFNLRADELLPEKWYVFKLFHGTLSRMDQLALGLLAAVVSQAFNGWRPAGSARWVRASSWGVIAVCLGALLYFPSWNILGFLVLGVLFTACVLWVQRPALRALTLGRWESRLMAPLMYVGKLSFGLYLFHPITRAWVDQLLPTSALPAGSSLRSIVFLAVWVVGTTALAAVSYRFFEAPLLAAARRKSKQLLQGPPGPLPEAMAASARSLGLRAAGGLRGYTQDVFRRAMFEQPLAPGERARARYHEGALITGGVLLQTLVLGYFASRGYFFVDDFINFMSAARPLSLEYLGNPVFQHLVPGYRLVFWGLHHGFPLNYSVALGVMVLFHALSAVVLFRLLRRLCSAELAAAGVLLWGISPIALRPMLWLATGLHYFPSVFFSLLALERGLAYWRHGRGRDLVLSVLGVALGLTFFIKPLLVLGYLGLLWLLFPGLRPQQRLWQRTLSHLVPITLVVVGYLAYFLTVYYFGQGYTDVPKPGSGKLLGYIGESLVRVFLPAFSGLAPDGHPAYWWVGGALALVLGVVCWRVRGGWRAGVFFLLAMIPNMAMVGLARLESLGHDVVYDLRFYSELSYLFAISLGLLLWQWRQPRAGRAGPEPVGRSMAFRGVALAVVVLAALRGHFFLRGGPEALRYGDTQAVEQYLANLVEDLRQVRERHGARPEEYSFFNYLVPYHVMPRFFGAFMSYGEFFQMLSPETRTDAIARFMYVIEQDGHVRPARFHPLAEGTVEQGSACLEPGDVTVWVLPGSFEMREGIIELEFDKPRKATGVFWSSDTEVFDGRLPALMFKQQSEAGATYFTFDNGQRRILRLRLDLSAQSEPVCVKRLRLGTHQHVEADAVVSAPASP